MAQKCSQSVFAQALRQASTVHGKLKVEVLVSLVRVMHVPAIVMLARPTHLVPLSLELGMGL